MEKVLLGASCEMRVEMAGWDLIEASGVHSLNFVRYLLVSTCSKLKQSLRSCYCMAISSMATKKCNKKVVISGEFRASFKATGII